jgi:hypothetical protein
MPVGYYDAPTCGRVGEAIRMAIICRIGFGFSAALMVAAMMLGCPTFAAPAATDTSPYAPVLQRIFVTLDAKGADMTFGGPIAIPLGISPHGEAVPARELPPIKTDAQAVVYLFYRFEDDSGYIVARFAKGGFTAVRFDANFNFVTAAAEPYGQPAAALSTEAAQTMLSQELRDWQAIDERLAAHPAEFQRR